MGMTMTQKILAAHAGLDHVEAGQLINGILRDEWGCQGLIITDNVLSDYISGVDGVLAGVSTYDSMMTFIITNQLPKYSQDAAVVAAMREACHHDLYALANSTAMNGVGKDTTIKILTPGSITVVTVLFYLVLAGCLVCGCFWTLRSMKFRRGDACKDFRAYRKQYRAAQKTKEPKA